MKKSTIYITIIGILTFLSYYSFAGEIIKLKHYDGSWYPTEEYQYINKALQSYSMKICLPNESKLILKRGILDDFSCSECSESSSEFSYVVSSKLKDKYPFNISIRSNAFAQANISIEKSYARLTNSSRPNTWGGSAKDLVNIPGATYVAHFTSETGISLLFVYQNIFVHISDSWSITREQSAIFANLLVDTLFGEFSTNEKKDADKIIDLDFTKSGDDKAMITWQLPNKSTNNWVRMDASDGVLTIVGKNKVILEDIDEENVTVECFEIKPDGSLNAYGKLEIDEAK